MTELNRDDDMIATGAQIRAGRALLRWRQSDLAKAAGLHRKAIIYWERMGKVQEITADIAGHHETRH